MSSVQLSSEPPKPVSLPSPVNPFEESIDPRGYVPRAACHEALRSLERQIWAGVPAIVLRGPAGIGKSMLLAVLHQRMAEAWQIAHVSVSPSPSMEISHRILDLLEVIADDDPSSALVAAARRYAASGQRVLVIIDPATNVPIASSRQLARAAAMAGGDLCVLFGVAEEEGAEAFEREIAAEAELATVRFDSPMNVQETSEYIARRLDQTLDSQALRDRFDDAASRYVIDRAQGNPRRVNELAYETLRLLESGGSPPAPERDAGASVELDAVAPESPPEEPRLRSRAPAYDDATYSDRSLGGALLGAGPRRDPHELDHNRELFPPGFLRSDREPLAPPDQPGPGGAGAASASGDARGAAGARGPEVSPERGDSIAPEAPAAGAATAEGAVAVEGAAAVEEAAVAESAAALEGAAVAPAASSRRPTVWVAAMVVAALAGGYLAGRIDLASTEPSPPPPAAPLPVASDPEPVLPEPLPSLVPADRPGLDAPSGSAAVASSIPAAEPDTTLAASIDSGPALADAEPAAPSLVEDASAEPSGPRTIEVVERVESAPRASVQAVAPVVSPDRPPPISVTPRAAPAAEPQAEAIRVASDSSTPSQPPTPPAPAPGSPVGDEQSIADGSVTAIVVEARSTAEPGTRASAYVRVQVRLEPGAILTIDGERVGVAPFSDLIMEPGLHTFVAEMPDGLQIEQLIQVTPDTGVVEF